MFVVDDDRDVRTSLARSFAVMGVACETFGSAKEFFDRPPHAGPSCLVLDLKLPDLNGLEIQACLAEAGRDPSELQVTGTLPLVKADDGSFDLDRTMEQVPAFADAGLTDLRGRFKLPDDRSAAVDELSRIVAAFRAAAGRSD